MMQSATPGRLLISLVAFSNGISTFLADWNETHIFNPRWPPHAKFHNGQTMSMGLVLGLMTLFYAWRPASGDPADSLRTAALIGSVYWVTGLSAILYPEAKAIDPEFGEGNPQLYVFGTHLALVWLGYWLEMGRMGSKGAKSS